MELQALLQAAIIAAIVCAFICGIAWALTTYVFPAPASRWVWLIAILLCVLIVLRLIVLPVL